MVEEWKDISGFEGAYQVSNLGRVKSLDRLVNIKNGVRCVRERILRAGVLNGYKHVRLSLNNRISIKLVHRLVAGAFIDNPNNYPCVNHIDGNPSNNNYKNLEWCTYAYNSNYFLCKMKQSNRMSQRYRDDPNFLKSCKDRLGGWHMSQRKAVCQILDDTLIRVWDSTRATAEGGFVPNDVGQCANGKRRKHRGYTWAWLTDYKERG